MTASSRMLELSSVDNILVVGAHAFDAEIMAGGFAATATRCGAAVTLLHLTLGEQGHRTLTPEEYAAQKRIEATAASEALGASVRFFAYQDAQLPLDDEVALRVCEVIRDVRPSIVVGHWRGSWHKDHQAAHRATVNGVFFAALPTLKHRLPVHSPRQVLFAENWEDGEGFQPQVFVDVTDGFDAWMRAVECYELGRGNLASFPYTDYYASLTRLHGCITGVERAEAFMSLGAAELAGMGQFVGRGQGEGA